MRATGATGAHVESSCARPFSRLPVNAALAGVVRFSPMRGRSALCRIVSAVATAGLLFGTGCRVDRAPMDAAHAERVAVIDRTFDVQIADSDRRWNELKAQILQQRQYLVKMDAAGKPEHPVVNDFIAPWNTCQESSGSAEADALRANCEADVRNNYWRAFGRRYFKADLEALAREQREHPDLDVEAFAANSHNQRLKNELKSQIAEIEKHKAEFRATMNGYRDQRVELSAQQRNQEIEAADRRRRAIWAAALQGLADGMQNASRASSSHTNSSAYAGGNAATEATKTGCTSDFSCGVGQTCVKQFYNSTGVCMRAANEYGGPSFDLPDLDSVGPNMPSANSCTSVGATCPAGFRCDYGSGRCIR